MTYSIKGDIHTHTLFSRHAYSTITENVAAARERGLEVLGSADHFSSMISSTVYIRDYQFFINQSVWPRMWGGVMVLRGAETDILTLDGGLFGQDIVCPENIVGRALKIRPSLSGRLKTSTIWWRVSITTSLRRTQRLRRPLKCI